MIRQGKWCRDHQSLNGQHCALGLINYAPCLEGRLDSDVPNAAFELLDFVIPKDEYEQLQARVKESRRGRRYQENGGTYRGSEGVTSRIASFNNTRPTEREVIAWFQDAIEELSEIPVEA